MKEGIEFNLLYNPLNIIKGNNRAGAKELALLSSLNNAPVKNPILLPTNARAQRATT